MGNNILTKFTLVSFPHNCEIWVESGPKAYNLMPQAIMSPDSLSKNLKHVMMGFNSYTKVAVNIPKNFPFWVMAISAKFGTILCNLMSHDSLSEDFFCNFVA